MERFQKTVILLGLPFLFIVALLLTKGTDWQEVALGLMGRGENWWFFPSGVSIASFLGAFAYAGAGGNLNLAQSYYVKEKGFGMGKYAAKISSLFSKDAQPISIEGHLFSDTPTNRKRWKAWWKMVTLEHFMVFWTLGLLSIIVLSALARATVYGRVVESGLSFLYMEANVIGDALGTTVKIFFLLLAALMLFSTQLGVLESSARIISENVLLLTYKKGQKVNVSKGFYIVLWLQILLGIGIYMWGITEPRVLITFSAILNAAAMMMSFGFVYFLNRRELPKRYHPGIVRKLTMLSAFSFFLYFLVVTILG